MKNIVSSFPTRPDRLRTGSRMNVMKLAILASLALIPAGHAAKKPSAFKEFAGPYKGSSTIGSLGVFVNGSGEGSVRGRGPGGIIVLRGTITFSGQTRRVYRTLAFKRRTFTSNSRILTGFNDHFGNGAGKCSIRAKGVTYSENTLFTFPNGDITQMFRIKGSVVFNRRFVQVSEVWNGGNFGTNTYKFRLRPR